MNVVKLSAVFLGGAFLLSASAFASDMNKKSLHLYEKVTVNGTQLAPGDYKVEWNGSGPQVQINILEGKQTVATVPARVVSEAKSNNQDGYALKPGKDGRQDLAQVFFSGEKYDLDLSAGHASNASQGSNSSGAN